MEKSPKEIGRLFEVVHKKADEQLQALLPLKVKLESIFAANQADMEAHMDERVLISLLLKLEEPAEFVRARDDAKKYLDEELRRIKSDRNRLDQKCQVDLIQEIKDIKDRTLLIPQKVDVLINRFNSLEYMISDEGSITKVFKVLEKYNNSKRKQLTNKTRWHKSLLTTIRFGSIVVKMVETLISTYHVEDEFKLNSYIHKFDMMANKLLDYDDIDNILDNTEDEDEYPTDKHISNMYEKIRAREEELELLIQTIDSKEEIERLIDRQKDRLVQIHQEQKILRLKIMKLDGPIEWATKELDTGKYVLPVFWEQVSLNLDDYSNKVIKLLKYPDYANWLDARKKYALITRISLMFGNFSRMFASLLDGYDSAMSNLKQAKRNYNRYQDRSSTIALEKSTMHPVVIDDLANKLLGQFYLLCKNMTAVDTYINDTNKFLIENVVLVEEMYSELKPGLMVWSVTFRDMFK